MRSTIRGQLVAICNEQYTNCVFKNLDESNNSKMRYITVTICPNWVGSIPNLGETGFVEYDYVEAGDEYFQKSTNTMSKYNYTNYYFIRFIKDTEKIINKDFKF